MPQLDSNNFIYQYVGIIILLIVVYTTLSYIVLPILLRLILIRNLFLNTRQTSTELVNVVSNNYKQLVSFKNSGRTFNLTSSFISTSVLILSRWINLMSASTLINSCLSTVTFPLVSAQTSTIDYFILFLLIELENDE